MQREIEEDQVPFRSSSHLPQDKHFHGMAAAGGSLCLGSSSSTAFSSRQVSTLKSYSRQAQELLLPATPSSLIKEILEILNLLKKF